MNILGWLKMAALTSTLIWPMTATANEGRIYTDNGVAIGGTDAVAYFTVGEPVQGSVDYTVDWSGATWHFASDEHRALFEATPEAYAPRYGGWCAWAAAQGYAAGTVPDAWRIVDDKLYLNASRGVQRRWERDIPGFIQAADANWPNIF